MAAPKVEPASHITARVIGNFAYLTARDRLPVFVIKVIDLLSRRATEIEGDYGAIGREEAKQVIGRLAKLRNELQTNKDFIRLEDSSKDVSIWNNQLVKEPNPRWFEGTWLFAECYFFRRIFEAFQLTTTLKSYDYFAEMKTQGLLESMDAVDALTGALASESSKVTLSQLIEISLWGNKCDLCISAGEERSQKVDPLLQLSLQRANILQNDLAEVVEYIHSKGKLQLHLVLDNAGFELMADLILLDYLMRHSLVTRVVIFVKMMPWFISDSLLHDIHFSLDQLQRSKCEATAALGRRCQTYLHSRQWCIEEHMYWTLPFDYASMPQQDPQLYEQLRKSDLIIFKGDLNYRKLVGDREWEPTTNFRASLLGFEPAPLVTLRTIKAETVTGLREGVAEATAEKTADWRVTGDYAVVQFVNPRC